jgi:hypothetical protein
MKTFIITLLLVTFGTVFTSSQNKNTVISEIKNDEVAIKLHKFIEFNSSNAKTGNKFIIADITIENLTNKNIEMGAEYTMGLTLKDASGNEYRSGLRGAGIVSSYLAKNGSGAQDQKAYNLCFGDKFPPKTKARSLLCGFEVPNDVKVVSFGVKKKNLWSDIKK